jgi:hypothetical protein
VRSGPARGTPANSVSSDDVELTLREHSGTEGFAQLLRPTSL